MSAKVVAVVAVVVFSIWMVPFCAAATDAALNGTYTFSLADEQQYGAQTIVGTITFDGAGDITALSYTSTTTTKGGGKTVCTGGLKSEGTYTVGSSEDLGSLSMTTTSSCKGKGGPVTLGLLVAAPANGIATVVYLTPVAGKGGNGPSGLATLQW